MFLLSFPPFILPVWTAAFRGDDNTKSFPLGFGFVSAVLSTALGEASGFLRPKFDQHKKIANAGNMESIDKISGFYALR
jgi:hypothetical protein